MNCGPNKYGIDADNAMLNVSALNVEEAEELARSRGYINPRVVDIAYFAGGWTGDPVQVLY